jgi:hypothetical protein
MYYRCTVPCRAKQGLGAEERRASPQRTQSAGPIRFLIFCSISIFLLASIVAGWGPQCSAGPPSQRMYSTIPTHRNIKSAPASPGRSRAGPALYVFSLLGHPSSRPIPLPCRTNYCTSAQFTNFVRELLVNITSGCVRTVHHVYTLPYHHMFSIQAADVQTALPVHVLASQQF